MALRTFFIVISQYSMYYYIPNIYLKLPVTVYCFYTLTNNVFSVYSIFFI